MRILTSKSRLSVPLSLPGISSCNSRNMVLKAVCNRVVKVPFEIALQEGHSAVNVFHWGGIECLKLGGCPLVQHGNTVPLHAKLWGQRDWIKSDVLRIRSKEHPPGGRPCLPFDRWGIGCMRKIVAAVQTKRHYHLSCQNLPRDQYLPRSSI
jgi:hypothetical protein